MKLIQLRAFCSVVDRGSFRSAARELDAAQSTLTESVQSLERELGVTLLVRSNQGISLTLAGKVFLTRARSIILDCDRAVQDVRQWNGTPEGQIALGVTAEPMAACLMPVFSSFTRRFPKVQLHVASGKTRMLIEMIRAGRLDFVMGPLSPDVCDIDLHIERLYSSKTSVIARKGHPLAGARSVHDLADSEWISVRPAGVVGSAENHLIELFKAQGLSPPKIAITTESLLEILHIISETDYLTIEPSLLPGMKLFSSSLISLSIQEPLESCEVCLISRRVSPFTHVTQELTSMLISYSRLRHRAKG
ncbi:MAG: LysR substrate-binding domain-containing protein [Pseudomonas sp.]|jgi:DNA-binding transcriptional LysR family regulator|nr:MULTISPECIES: LysR substrate-binding domain-containing protein [Pseudomonas]MDI1330452.1 LysR substrate-binding domain-containing protein [Pseudomonas sp.]MDO9330312.1 LysR substrate-binding domain-containing protein [Pseudomonas sp.]QZB00362.1 LysR family transcriptional regulator [Pseudomonas mandelii]